ncbi:MULTISPECIES: nucleotide disphospho-sugar-binding domain-containing protein [unclassified Saccharothrix]|uniref:nucleotide disphospho-sugar-binding domain-containing protein n=1 Tax=unclassified Saccharothrix TaxID=2593673 RepID=UPI00307EBF74
MKVLFVSAPLVGHVFPMVPLATALRAAGHDVLLATGGDALAVEGVDVVDVAPGIRFGRVAAATALRHPLALCSELAGGADLRFASHLFAAVNARMVDGVVEHARRWRPDLVVHEPFAVAGARAAAELSVPAVVHEMSLFDGAQLASVTLARTAWQAPDPAAVLRIAPPSLMATGDAWPLRAVPHSGDGPVPEWLAVRPDRPRVLVSRSTVGGPGGSRLMAAVVAVADRVDAEFVLARPGRLADKPLPANVRAVDWVPFSKVLPTCSAVVHHGGAGTLFSALAAGIPQLVEPGAGDRERHARLVAERGAGLAEREVTAEVLTRLVTDPALAAAAREVSAEMAAMPVPEDLVPRLEGLSAGA